MPRFNPRPYLTTGVAEGWTANEAYRRYLADARAAEAETGDRWLTRQRTVFLQMYSGMRYASEHVVDAMNAPKDVAFGGLTPQPREATFHGRYLYAAAAWTRIPGSSDLDRTVHLFHSAEELTPQQVEDMARQQIEDSAVEAHGTFAGFVVESVVFTGVERLVRRQR